MQKNNLKWLWQWQQRLTDKRNRQTLTPTLISLAKQAKSHEHFNLENLADQAVRLKFEAEAAAAAAVESREAQEAKKPEL